MVNNNSNYTCKEILAELEKFGNERTKKIFLKHGAKEPLFGVKVQDLKTILKKVKKNHELSLELYATGNSDAMYLAGLMADEDKISKHDLEEWIKGAYWYMLSEYTVAWVASESKFGYELGLSWIDSTEERVASAGWSTLSSYISIIPDNQLDIDVIAGLLDRIEKNIHISQNRERYTMNGFVIAVGTYIEQLTKKALLIAKNIGTVTANAGFSSCRVPVASDYILKVAEKGRIGKKRKIARC